MKYKFVLFSNLIVSSLIFINSVSAMKKEIKIHDHEKVLNAAHLISKMAVLMRQPAQEAVIKRSLKQPVSKKESLQIRMKAEEKIMQMQEKFRSEAPSTTQKKIMQEIMQEIRKNAIIKQHIKRMHLMCTLRIDLKEIFAEGVFAGKYTGQKPILTPINHIEQLNTLRYQRAAANLSDANYALTKRVFWS